MVSEVEICKYREIYYETVKPLIRAGKSTEEIDVGVKYACEEYEMTVERYHTLSTVDLLQRLAEDHKTKKIKVQFHDGEIIDASHLHSLPRLRCPRRSEWS
jgi:hypothetical protein